MPNIIKDIDQGSDDWKKIRLGSIGGSRAYALLVSPKKKKDKVSGKHSASWITLQRKMAKEIITGMPSDDFKSKSMERGILYEPEARSWYEREGFINVDIVGVVLGDIKGTHVSPDGFVGSEGTIEIKVPEFETFCEYEETRKIEPVYIKQCQHLLWVSERKWTDFVVYNPEVGCGIITRIERDEKMITELERQAKIFLTELDELVRKLRGMK